MYNQIYVTIDRIMIKTEVENIPEQHVTALRNIVIKRKLQLIDALHIIQIEEMFVTDLSRFLI